MKNVSKISTDLASESRLIKLVQCGYSKFQIELNSYFSIRFDSK